MKTTFFILCFLFGAINSLTLPTFNNSEEFDLSRATKYGIMTNYGGPVLKAPVAYFIFYGSWTTTQIALVTSFASGIGTNPWWNINLAYGAGKIKFGASYKDAGSLGKSLDDLKIKTIAENAVKTKKLKKDPNGIYLVLTSSDVIVANFCSIFCGWHLYSTSVGIAYGFVGRPNPPCGCLRLGNLNVSPNNDPGTDSVINTIAHELAEAATDPQPLTNPAWFNPENADVCNTQFLGVKTLSNGARYNLSFGGKNYLIQSNFNLKTQSCSNS